MNPVKENSFFSLKDILASLEALGDENLFVIAHTIYMSDEPALSIEEIADEVGIEHETVQERVDRLTEAGIIDTRMECLINEDCTGVKYELREFGRLAFEEGVNEIINHANKTTK